MGFDGWIRQIHRWTSIVFVLIPIGIFAALGMGEKPVQWVYYLPLPPLALLALTSLYMFVLPHVRRGAR
jgi:hypothetical protein